MKIYEHITMIAIVALATFATRLAPFLVFKSEKPKPQFLVYIGKALPPAVFGMLVVYCLGGVPFSAPSYALPEIISVAVVVLLHLLFRKMLLSIAGGTILYIILVNLVFV